ncbi:MAG: DUF3391 domain-containing protein [Proteobacteria bacterium]|nr:DUF3391 domain-containing protein [Pseudomonadota bacterium]
MPKKKNTSPLSTTYSLRVDELRVGMFVVVPSVHLALSPFIAKEFLLEEEFQIEAFKESAIPEVLCDPIRSLPISYSQHDGPGRTGPAKSEQDNDETRDRIRDLWREKRSLQSLNAKRNEQHQAAVGNHLRMGEYAQEVEKMILTDASEKDVKARMDEEWVDFKKYAEALEPGAFSLMASLVNTRESTLPYRHNVNVASLAFILSSFAGLNLDGHMRTLVTAALLHDIGYWKISRSAQTWRAMYTPKQLEERRKHISEGVKIIERYKFLPKALGQTILHHHEKWNGTGYLKLKGEEIDEFARVISVCNFYDRLVNNPNPAERCTPRKALARMFQVFNYRFDPGFLEYFIKVMDIYPAGSVVLLSTNQTALVIATDPEHYDNPEVLVYDPGVKREDAVYYRVKDLGKNVEIKEDINPEELPGSIRRYLSISDNITYTPLF